MKVTVKHYLYQVQWSWEAEPKFALYPFLMEGEQYALVREMDVDLDIPDDFDPRPQQIAALEEQRKKAIEHKVESMSANNGGPAFPHDAYHYEGMTLRDYFATKAPLHDLKFGSAKDAANFAGMAEPKFTDELISVVMVAAAKASYIFADAMLKERDK